MTMTAGAVFGLVALGLVGLALIGVILGSGDDDDEIDHQEYNDWERIRGLPPASIPARTAGRATEPEQCAAAESGAVPPLPAPALHRSAAPPAASKSVQ